MTAENGMEKERQWKWKMKTLKSVLARKERWKVREKAHHFALLFISPCYERQMKSDGCQVKGSKTSASLLKWAEERNGEERGRVPGIMSPSQKKLWTVKRTKTPCIRICTGQAFQSGQKPPVTFQKRWMENVFMNGGNGS